METEYIKRIKNNESTVKKVDDIPEPPQSKDNYDILGIVKREIAHNRDKKFFIFIMLMMCLIMLMIFGVSIKMSFILAEIAGTLQGYIQ